MYPIVELDWVEGHWMTYRKECRYRLHVAFTKQQCKIERAIKKVIGHHDMLFFAATSNDNHYSKDPDGHPPKWTRLLGSILVPSDPTSAP
jgi:hypothetical protein